MAAQETPRRGTVTRNDVARLAGVSTAVVSYVINGTKNVSPGTKARVHHAIEKLGYQPNRTARSLRMGSSEMFGMVVPDATNQFFSSLAHHVEQAAAERGYTLLTANADGSLNVERKQLDVLVSRGVDGLFICSNIEQPDVHSLLDAGISFVLVNQFDELPGVNSVGVDLYQGAFDAVTHLAEHGHRTVGFIEGKTFTGVSDARQAGWLAAVQAHQLIPGPVVMRGYSAQGGYEAGRELIETGRVPEAIFVGSDQLGVGLLRALHEAGLRVPDDVAIVSFDGTIDSEFSWPPLTTISQPVDLMARAAVEALIDSHHSPRNQVFSPTLIRRASCGCNGLG